jgi:hypothetical protein
MLPVETVDAGVLGGDEKWVMDVRERRDLRPLRELARYRTKEFVRRDLWDVVAAKGGPFKVAHTVAKPGAVVDVWLDWGPPPPMDEDGRPVALNPYELSTKPENGSPYIARIAYGQGSVVWVAQDLGSPTLTGPDSTGWPYVWAHVLGWRAPDLRIDGDYPRDYEAQYTTYNSATADVGYSLLAGMEHQGKAGFYIFLAVVFFIGYWVVAGPGSYFVLANKKRKELSWTIFAVSALLATALTVLVVRLVLRGQAEAHHSTVVRLSPGGLNAEGQPTWMAVADSRIGLYIPRDGPQPVGLAEVWPDAVSYITPFAIHPEHIGDQDTGFTDWSEYTVPVPDTASLTNAPPLLQVYYRSTLKKLQARWVGSAPGGVGGGAKLIEPNSRSIDFDGDGKAEKAGTIEGVLTNNTGADLKNVYFVFNQRIYKRDNDWVLWVPQWPNGAQLDLAREFNFKVDTIGKIAPGGKTNVKGYLTAPIGSWDQYWYNNLGKFRAGDGDKEDDSAQNAPKSYIMMSVFDRIPANKAEMGTGVGGFGAGAGSRHDVLRRGGRHLDLSHLVAAGQLVVVAQAQSRGGATDKNPLPFPLQVWDERVDGTGSILYQFALPLDRSEVEAVEAKAAELERKDREEKQRPERAPQQQRPAVG